MSAGEWESWALHKAGLARQVPDTVMPSRQVTQGDQGGRTATGRQGCRGHSWTPGLYGSCGSDAATHCLVHHPPRQHLVVFVERSILDSKLVYTFCRHLNSYLQNFMASMDEEWFRLVHVAIEAAAGPALAQLPSIRVAAGAGDIQQVEGGLSLMCSTLEQMQSLLGRMGEKCDPQVGSFTACHG